MRLTSTDLRQIFESLSPLNHRTATCGSITLPKDVECIAESTHDAKDEGEVIDFMEIIKERGNKKPT